MKNLSDTANGELTGKRKMTLETYVQTNYFDRILRRANLRLLTMSSGQYELIRQQETENRREKTGLELDVLDHYNGSRRSVKTLSGGESFQASLSLALGLSDEIQSCAGGVQLDAMFPGRRSFKSGGESSGKLGRRKANGRDYLSCVGVERTDRKEDCSQKIQWRTRTGWKEADRQQRAGVRGRVGGFKQKSGGR